MRLRKFFSIFGKDIAKMQETEYNELSFHNKAVMSWR
jgi:hypothetical protein